MLSSTKLKVCILISGRGSNMMALVNAAKAADFPAEIVSVIANEPDAAGLEWAKAQGIPTALIPHRPHGKDRQAFETKLDAAIRATGAQLVMLAGFMRLLSPFFVEKWLDRLVNIHPSLLPAFPGLHVHRQVLDYGAKFTGCTVHYVRPAMDHGPIIIQAAVPVHPDDDEDRLAARVLEMEHKTYPAALRLIAEGRVNVHEEKAFIANAPLPPSTSNPALS